MRRDKSRLYKQMPDWEIQSGISFLFLTPFERVIETAFHYDKVLCFFFKNITNSTNPNKVMAAPMP